MVFTQMMSFAETTVPPKADVPSITIKDGLPNLSDFFVITPDAPTPTPTPTPAPAPTPVAPVTEAEIVKAIEGIRENPLKSLTTLTDGIGSQKPDEALGNLDLVIDALVGLERPENQEQNADLSNQFNDYLMSMASVFEDATPETVKNTVLSTLDKSDALIEAMDKTQLRETLSYMIEQAVKASSSLKIEAPLAGDQKIEVSENALLEKVEEMLSFVEAIEKTNSDLIGKKVEKLVQIEIESSEETVLELPEMGKLFELVDAVEIKSNFATIKLTKQSMNDDTSAPKIEIKPVDKSALPASVKAENVIDFGLVQDDKAVEKFAKPITITIPYTLKEGENPDHITAFYLDEKGQSIAMSGYYQDGQFTFKTNHFSMFYVASNPTVFTDVVKNSWAKQYIDSITAKGLMKGIGNQRFNPKGDVSRAQFVVMLSALLNNSVSEMKSPFNDVSSKDWYHNGVMMLYEAGLLTGYSATFNPNEALTREEMGVLVGRYLKHIGYTDAKLSVLNPLKDASTINTQNLKMIAVAVEQGVILGSNGMYLPKDHMSREQASVVLYKLINK